MQAVCGHIAKVWHVSLGQKLLPSWIRNCGYFVWNFASFVNK